MHPDKIKQKDLIAVFGFSESTFSKLNAADPLPVAESLNARSGCWYYYDDVLLWVIKHYREKLTDANTRAASYRTKAKPKPGKKDDGEGETMGESKARLLKEQADKEEILNQQRRGEVISVIEVQEAQEKINAFASKRLAHVGSDVMRELPNQPAKTKEIIDAAMSDVVDALAGFEIA